MKLRVPTAVVVAIMVLVSFAGMSQNVRADAAPDATPDPNAATSASEYQNGTLPNPPPSTPETVTGLSPSAIESGQNTSVYTFDSTSEGFTKQYPQPNSEVAWDSANKRVSVYNDRRDAGDEMFIHTTNAFDTTADFFVVARWTATVQGNWQRAYPLFLAGAGSTQVDAASSIWVFYDSRDSNLGQNPHYNLRYRDSSGSLRLDADYTANVSTEYHFYISYDSSIQMLTMAVRSSTDALLKLVHYRIGTNPNDGFTVGKIGVASHGWSASYEPTMTAWTDDIVVTSATGLYRDATEDRGDHATKIGWLADNFNDNTNEIWTTDSGTVSFSGGVMQLAANSAVHAGSSWYDQKFAFTVTFLTLGAVGFDFRRHEPTGNNQYELSISGTSVNLYRKVDGVPTTLGSFAVSISTGVPYQVKIVATGNYFEVWWQGVRQLAVTDSTPPSPMSGYIEIWTSATPQIKVDDVRLWNTAAGYESKAVRDAGTVNKPLQTQIAGTVDAFNQVHLQIRSSADNVTWGLGTNLKADVKAGFNYPLPDQDRQRYYQVRTVLTSGVEGTPTVTSVTTQEGTPATNPAANTGFEAWYPYVGGLVNAVNGNVWYSTGDLSLRGKGFTLSVVRSYNSLLGSTVGPFGNGWTFDYNEYLTLNPDSSVTWNDGDGSQHTFQPKATTGTYDAPRGVSSRLIKNVDNTFTLWMKDGSLEIFSPTGVLSEIMDKNGNALVLTYTSGRLTSVADASGKALYFGYDASGHVVRAWDQEAGLAQNSPTAHSGSWTNGQNAFSSNNVYASTKTSSALHTFSGYGFAGTLDVGIWKVEACVEAYTAGDDDLGVKISTNGGTAWSTEQVVNLPGTDQGALTCLDFTPYKATWWWSDLSDANFRVQVRYVKVGTGASYDYLDWIPVKVSTASRLVRYEYDGPGNLIKVFDAMGARTEQYWYASNKLSQMTDHTGGGKWTKFIYDGSNRATEVWLGAYNNTLQWQYRAYVVAYSTATTRTITNARGYATTLTLNSFGNPTQISGPSICGLGCAGRTCACCDHTGNTTSYAWDGEMNKIRITDGRGYAWTTGFDYRSDLISRADPGGNVTTSAWTELNTATQYAALTSSQTTFRGYTTLYAFDAKANLIKTTNARGDYTDYVYDAAGFLNRSTDFRHYTNWYEYNANGYLTRVTDPLSQVTRYGYDAWGHLTTVTSPLTFVTTTEYDKDGRVTKVTDPLGNFTSNTYSARGDLIRMTDKNGNSTAFQVNVTNGMVRVQTDALGNSTSSAFDLRGNLVTITDANNHVTRYEHDSYDRLTQVTTPQGYLDGFFTSYAYDAAGNLIRRTDANGAATVHTYDELERVTVAKYPDATTVTQSYDEDGKPVAAAGSGYTKTTAYDELGRVATVTFNYGSFQKMTTYTYDPNGNRLTLSDAEGGTTTYAYDAANRQWKITDPEGRITSYVFDRDSRITSTSYPNGITTTNTLDAAGRLTKVESKSSGGAVVESFEYTYDKVGNRLSVKLADASTTTYEYDKLNRLAGMVKPGPATTVYSYDAVGNLVQEVSSSSTDLEYDADDRLSNATTGHTTVEYSYDNNGNRISFSFPGLAVVTYTYDYENRLTGWGSGNAYTYAPTGQRVSSTSSGATTYYGHDFAAAGGLSDITAEYDSSGIRQARYTHGSGADEPLEQLRGGSYYTYQKDGLGSVSRLTDSSQNTVNTYDYSPWGDTTVSGSLTNPFQYTGREKDSAPGSALYHYRARVYDPDARRFVQKDPAGMVDGTNLYEYAGNSPVNRVDPSGLGCWLGYWGWTFKTVWSWSRFNNCVGNIRPPGGLLICLGGCFYVCLSEVGCLPCLLICAAVLGATYIGAITYCYNTAWTYIPVWGYICLIPSLW